MSRPTGGAAAPPPEPGRGNRLTPYFLLLPAGLALLVFFLLPILTLVNTSLQSGGLEEGFRFTWQFSNYVDVWADYWPQFLRSFVFAATATVLTILIAYPIAYMIAFKAGRWRSVLLVLVIAPFFTSFLIRTLAWTTILSDNGAVVGFLRSIGFLAVTDVIGLTSDSRVLATPLAVIIGLTYNFLPFMVLPHLRLAGEAGHQPAAGGRRPVRELVVELLEGDLAAVAAGRGVRDAADLHPGDR